MLNVHGISVAPEWVAEPQDQTAAAGEDLTVLCSAYGVPAPSLAWYRKGIISHSLYETK